MKLISEFRQPELVQAVVNKIKQTSLKRKIRLMEFCGGHTVAIMKNGLRQLLPSNIELVSGPGCPVCVTDNADIDKAIALACLPNVILTTFGDMFKVPGSRSSLQEAKAAGADVRMVYSTMDTLKIARGNPEKTIIFLGIGFETTAPTVADSVVRAKNDNIKNYYVLSLHKLCPPVIRALLGSGEVRLDGLICPGHVSAIIGAEPWGKVAGEFKIPCVISGFEPLDILLCVSMLVAQMEKGETKVEIAYGRGVRPEGNPTALNLMDRVFEPCPAKWRGMGEVADSGLKFRKEFARFDAELTFKIDPGPTIVKEGCICGDILRGVKTPKDCKLFGKACTPEKPIGPCMVSSEGSCAAYYSYGEDHE